jgi:hypothetical protein
MTTVASAGKTAAIIGSFRQHYPAVVDAVDALRKAGIEVTSPLGTGILEPGIDFVRFESDDTSYDDSTVQTIALHRILRADAVYVIAPDGYIGRTTSYEIGRIRQAERPVYFSERPRDLPIEVLDGHIPSATQFAASVIHSGHTDCECMTTENAELERRLLVGDYLDE